ncbi:hypothetical protein BLA18110_07748 [Burkholderia lata]|uniref:hypothetical protein n=1 Tax=Burkholderia lata (strain ATCC 17760 / DSM 23089 / LMG 22485 / NCIMB 9086 / R18194 / 383) TaxID=482957 RepID=UPI001453F475|nr:hypothetical protein [Burkholderia lata]VWD52215.1 hypothetical protein BLA18110_07748 [Burkholderia lata]
MHTSHDQLFDLDTYLDEEVLQAYTAYQPEALNKWTTEKETSTLGLDGSTARAMSTGFRGEDGPIQIYNAWAKSQLLHATESPGLVAGLGTRDGFEEWHRHLTSTLVAYWRKRVTANNMKLESREGVEFIAVNPELSVAHRYKMVDLFVRYLRVQGTEHPELARHCFEFGHIPLDRKSLAVISAAFSGISVGKNFSMGNVATESMYRTQQRLARAICERAGGTPLLLDVFSLKSKFADALYKKLPPAPSRKKKKREPQAA